MKTLVPIVHKISFFINAFKYTYPNQYQLKRRELTKKQDSSTHQTNITEGTLSLLVRELSDHASVVPPKRQQQVYSLNTNKNSSQLSNAGGGKRFNSQRDYSKNDRYTKQCDYYKRVLKRLGYSHTKEECKIKSG